MLAKKCFIFPGQGSQSIGMANQLIEKFPEAKKKFEDAEKILNMPLLAYISNDCDEFKQTDVVQPAIYTMSCAISDILLSYDFKPDFLIGHSLGEYAAMYASGVITFEQGLNILKVRGKAMQEACEKRKSGMYACIMKNTDEANITSCEKMCKDASEVDGNALGVCEVANYNSNEQIVISGDLEALERAKEISDGYNVRKCIPLKVAGAYHSSLMKEAANKLETYLNDNIILKEQEIPIIWNVCGHEYYQDIKDILCMQVTNRVRWHECMQYAKEMSVDYFYEIGPGSILTNLLKKSNIACESISCPEL